MNVISRDKCIIFILILEILSINALPSSSKALNIAVIGAGAAGLASAKNALEQGHNVVIYEKTKALGGIWWYTDETGKDEYGINIHTAMYQGLRFSSPNYPQFEGADFFKGKIMHSHDYRRAEDFRDENVLVIGSGNSGMDIVLQLSKTANRVTWSRRKPKEPTEEERRVYGDTVTFKNDVERLISNGVEFMDGTHQNFTVIICATGYRFTYPMLDVDTGIQIDDNFVQPLYKQTLNINHPTMAFIGMTGTNFIFDLQVRFALKFISGTKKLPSKSEMLKDLQDFVEDRQKKGIPKSRYYHIGLLDKEYYEKVAQTADITKIPDVYLAICKDLFQSDPFRYREYKYTIIDDKTFKKEREV
ncbi:senecionine N-oxygenase-like isoform X2 [Contarinia nasturtii]|uniref:senecionine N-oxygenase-like isoform X2 n=1 Tax=Contarinia nasturtii TaxID=265458 RepID=UPI0012D39537|nr:senecionine N-oxygenase-like isoform X2 [Contarinia nasturtii]